MDVKELAQELCYNDEFLDSLKTNCSITISLNLLKEINEINSFVIDTLLETDFNLEMVCDDEEGCYYPEAEAIFEYLCTIYDVEDVCAKVLKNKALWKKFMYQLEDKPQTTEMFKNKLDKLVKSDNIHDLAAFVSSSSRVMFLIDDDIRDRLYDYAVQENLTDDIMLMQSMFFFDYLFKKGWRPDNLREAIYAYIFDTDGAENVKNRLDTVMQYPDLADFVSKITVGWYLSDMEEIGYELTPKQREIVAEYRNRH